MLTVLNDVADFNFCAYLLKNIFPSRSGISQFPDRPSDENHKS